jgi:hypothetical protein
MIQQKEIKYNYLKLGNSVSNYFVIEICSDLKSGRVMLVNRNDIPLNTYSFKEEGVKEVIKFLKLIGEEK